MPSTMIPIPPIHCVKLRQNRMPCGRDSMSEKTVAPVVVNPDTDSKSAWTGESMTPVNRYGSAPKTPIASQDRETTA